MIDALPLRWILLAIAAWVGLAVLLAALQYLQLQMPPNAMLLLQRMRALLGESTLFFLGPAGLLMLIWVLRGLLLRHWDGTPIQALATAVQVGAIVFAASTVLWAAIAGLAYLQDNDPWEALPGISPPYLDTFLARHPALSVTTYGGTHWLILEDADGHSVYLDGDDLVDARVRFQPCPQGVVAPMHLGGIPPFPGSQCSFLLHLKRGELERVLYAFDAGRDGDLKSIENHFSRWAAALGAEHRFHGGKNSHFFEARKGDSTWDLRLFMVQRGVRAIYIPQDGRTRAWPVKDTAAPQR